MARCLFLGEASAHDQHSHGRKKLIAEARVVTESSRLYLVQLCRHVSQVAKMHPEMQAQVEWSDDGGMINFGWGQCTLHAESGVLLIRAEAGNEEDLRRLEERLAERLKAFGRDDHLTVTWTLPEGEQVTKQTTESTKEENAND